jgi:hypothetical protein
MPRCDDGTMQPDSDFKKWAEELYRIMDEHGRSMRIDPNTKAHLERAGFVDVQERKIKILCNPWRTTDAQEELVGRWFNLALLHGLASLSVGPFMGLRQTPKDQFDDMVQKVIHESCLLRCHLYCNLYVNQWAKPFTRYTSQNPWQKLPGLTTA